MLWALAAVAAVSWLYFLARARVRGDRKRLALRATLLLVAAGLVFAADQRGLFARSSIGFRLALLLALLTVAVGYLYTTRFCPACGRMVRNLKPAQCPRCQAFLPRHGMTAGLRRPDDDARWDPLAPRRRGRRPGERS
jgi:hypothetical protein